MNNYNKKNNFMNKYNDTDSFPVNEKVDSNNSIFNDKFPITNQTYDSDYCDYKGINTINSQKLYNNLPKNNNETKINLTKKKKRIEDRLIEFGEKIKKKRIKIFVFKNVLKDLSFLNYPYTPQINKKKEEPKNKNQYNYQ